MTEDQQVRRFLPVAYAIARGYHLPGADHDDVRQEALAAVMLALRAYRPGPTPIGAFVAIVVRRRLITAVKQANADKHRALNESVREVVTDEGERLPALDVLRSHHGDPQATFELRDEVLRLRAAARRLSVLERRALGEVLDGIELRRAMQAAA